MLPFYYGIPSLLAREVARRPDDSRKWVEAGTLIALIFGRALHRPLRRRHATWWARPTQTAMALPIAAAGMAFDGVARVQFATFWAWERMRLETIATVAPGAGVPGGDGRRSRIRGRCARSPPGVHGLSGDWVPSQAGWWWPAPGRAPHPSGPSGLPAANRPPVHAVRGQRHAHADVHARRLGDARHLPWTRRRRPLSGGHQSGALPERARPLHQPRALSPDEQGVARSSGPVRQGCGTRPSG